MDETPKPAIRRPNRTTLEIPPPLRRWLDAEAERTGRPRSQLILQAIEELRDRREGRSDR